MDEHQFIRYRGLPAKTSVASATAASILNGYLSEGHSVSWYRKRRLLTFSRVHEGETQSSSVDFVELVDHLSRNRRFDPATFGLPRFWKNWIDPANANVTLTNFPPTPTGETVKVELDVPFGRDFPIRPRLDREGAQYASFIEVIQANIPHLHESIVSESRLDASRASSWLNQLRLLVNECISLVEITLHQLYLAAEFGAEPGLRFDRDRLGSRTARRLKDKLKWVHIITGKPLDDAREDLASFDELRKLRNHLNHFDPPVFAYTVEDIVRWLNLVPSVARLCWKIRERARAPVAPSLVRIVLLDEAVFVPRYPNRPVVPQGDDVGYRSSLWPPGYRN